MSTERQIAANRSNSQKSTGPRSATGKATSSQNACKTGIYSEAEVIRDENPADLAALAADYHSYYSPDGPAERAFVDILAHSEWLLRRLRRAEPQLWHTIMDLDTTGKTLPPDPEHDLGLALDAENGLSFARLQRRFDSTQRNFQRALKDLDLLRSSRPAAPPAPKIDPQSEIAPIGFVPSSPEPVPAASAQPAPSAPPAPIPPPSLLPVPPAGFVPSSASAPSAAPAPILTPYSLLPAPESAPSPRPPQCYDVKSHKKQPLHHLDAVDSCPNGN